MEIKFSSEVTVDTTGMIGKLVYVDGKPYIVCGGIIYLDGSGERGVKLDPIEEPKPIPQTKEVEWVNGNACRYTHDVEHEYIYIGEHPHGDGHYVFSEEKGITYIANGYLLKPETESEKLEREELELGESLMNAMKESFPDSVNHCSSDLLKWASVAKSIGYRKGEGYDK